MRTWYVVLKLSDDTNHEQLGKVPNSKYKQELSEDNAARQKGLIGKKQTIFKIKD